MEQFGRYVLQRQLAEGGMGELFLAQQSGIAGFAKKLVVKRIKPALAGDPDFVEMFLNEGRIAALIDHPNVVHIHELGEIEGRYFIAMEYVPGRSLADVMEQLGGPLEPAYAIYVMIGLCEGLAFAHEAAGLDGKPLGLVHRDVSPPNILLGYSGCVKVSDFGIAKIRSQRQTAVGVLKGKLAYLSPEQARGEEIDARSDIYALGLVLFEMTVGEHANPGSSDTGMIFAAAKGEVREPAEAMPGYPEELRRIFHRATALEPAARYQQVKELQEDLLAFQQDQRLVISASRMGEWLRALPGSRLEEELSTAGALDLPTGVAEPASGADALTAAAVELTPAPIRATPAEEQTDGGRARTGGRMAFAETVQAAHPGALELDLEKEQEAAWSPPGSAAHVRPSTRRGGAGLPVVAFAVLVALAGGGALLLHWLRGAANPSAGAVEAGPAADSQATAATRFASPSGPADAGRLLVPAARESGPAPVEHRRFLPPSVDAGRPGVPQAVVPDSAAPVLPPPAPAAPPAVDARSGLPPDLAPSSDPSPSPAPPGAPQPDVEPR